MPDPSIADPADDVAPPRDHVRRRLLGHLLANGGAADLRELSRAIAAERSDGPRESVGRAEARRVYAALRRRHVPKLEADGLLRYDGDEQAVYLERPGDVRSRLPDEGRGTGRDPALLLGSAALLAGLVAAELTGAVELPSATLRVATLGVVAVLLGVTLLRYRHERDRVRRPLFGGRSRP